MAKKIVKKDKHAGREAKKYAHPVPSREYVLEYLAACDRPPTLRQILKGLALSGPDEEEGIRRRLAAMVRDGQLVQNRKGAYGLPARMDLIAGRVIAHRDGFGFLVPDDGSEDLFIHARSMRLVFHEDRVLANVVGVDHRGRREATIVEVTERNTHELAGRYLEESGVSFVQPVNTRIPHDILIPPDKRHMAKHGQMVMARIVTFPSAAGRAMGAISEVLGDHMAPGMEIDLAIRNHELPHEWPAEVLTEAARFAETVPESAMEGRLDLRHLPFVTIDGEDAKDFDDAVYAEKIDQGFRLYVAIADVSHYVMPGSALDEEALNRGNSVYFPGQVIPMLPEVLSNGLCSLNPHVDRLVEVCEMTISASGHVMDARFHEAVFRSHARLTYNKVFAMLWENHAELCQQHEKLLPHLHTLKLLYQMLAKARKKRGSIDFDLPETRIIFGKDRKIERIVQMVRNEAHRLIEECMLCANICAARFLMHHKCPGLFRVHRGPSPEKLQDLRKFLGELALSLPGGAVPEPKDYAALLVTVADRPDAAMIQTVLLRSLSQALYSPENEGHFGLAFDAYTHFTSPIRRYPDLIVHRVIRSILQKTFKPGKADAVFEKYGEHCSMTERRADDATREAVDWLKCEYMMDQVGKEFPGIISGVTAFGIFVQLADIFVEGLIHISQLPNDYYHFDPLRHEIYGERSGRRFRLGTPVQILVARVDLDQRQIDFTLAGADKPDGERSGPRGNRKKPKDKNERSKRNEKSEKIEKNGNRGKKSKRSRRG